MPQISLIYEQVAQSTLKIKCLLERLREEPGIGLHETSYRKICTDVVLSSVLTSVTFEQRFNLCRDFLWKILTGFLAFVSRHNGTARDKNFGGVVSLCQFEGGVNISRDKQESSKLASLTHSLCLSLIEIRGPPYVTFTNLLNFLVSSPPHHLQNLQSKARVHTTLGPLFYPALLILQMVRM